MVDETHSGSDSEAAPGRDKTDPAPPESSDSDSRANQGRSNLGRGLAALFGDESENLGDFSPAPVVAEATPAAAANAGPKTLPIEQLHPGAQQPRTHFDDEAVAALAASITENGILQPILVRPHPSQEGDFEIIAGERRWRAAQSARLHEVPVVIRELSDDKCLEIAIVENVQRQDLTPLEEAEGYRRLIDEFKHTQAEVAQVVGKSRSHVANTLRLLGLPAPVRELIEAGELSAGHGRALLSAPDPAAAAKQIVALALNVRGAEDYCQKLRNPAADSQKPASSGLKVSDSAGASTRTIGAAPGGKDADTRALERDLEALLGLKVSVDFHGKEGSESGTLTIRYETLEQLDDVLRRLNQAPAARD